MNHNAEEDEQAQRRMDSLLGCMLGTAVGDAVGLPVEGLSKKRQNRMRPSIQGPCLIGTHGMVSDDTEHTCLVACALLAREDGVGGFSRTLGRLLRYWLLVLPAGIGFATLRGALKLWLGFPPETSGVFSAGNGPAMRCAILGTYFHDSFPRMKEYVHAATVITHTDPTAEHGAMAVALAACHMFKSCGQRIDTGAYRSDLRAMLASGGQDFMALMERCIESLEDDETTEAFAEKMGLGLGVSGYVCHTVPVAVHAALRHAPDLRTGVLAAVACGGDTDTTAAIAGGIIGAGTGVKAVPEEWLEHMWLWPLSVTWMRRLCTALERRQAGQPDVEPLRPPFWSAFPRNVAFLAIVLCHGMRRLLPPY